MKTIEMSDDEFNDLFGLLEEMKKQDHDTQASPRFWVPRSTKRVLGTEDDESLIVINSEEFELDDVASSYEDSWEEFSKDNNISSDINDYDFCADSRYWKEYVLDNIDGAYEVFVKNDYIEDVNPSFFKSDVKNFIEFNKHRLGEKPHTYARTIFRMDKMEKLMNAMDDLRLKMENNKTQDNLPSNKI